MNKDFWNGKKVLITGNTGFKGSWLSRILLNAGAKIYGYALENNDRDSIFNAIELYRDAECRYADICDRESLDSYVGRVMPDIVFHLAAQPIVRISYDKPIYTFQTNVIGTAVLFDCLRHCDTVRAIVNVTTDKVYENNESGLPFSETDHLGGYDPYSASKACSEIVTSSYVSSFFNPSEYGVKHNAAVVTARAGNVIGGGDFAPDRLIPDCIRAVRAGKAVALRNPDSVRPWENVLEPLFAYIGLAERLYDFGTEYSGAYNIGPSKDDCLKVADVIKLMSEYIPGLRYETAGNANGPHEANLLMLDTHKIENKFGFRNKLTVNENLRMTALWYQYQSEGRNMAEVTDEMIDEYFGL